MISVLSEPVDNEQGSGCGSVGRAVASGTRDPHFKSQYRQSFIYQLYINNRKDENKEKDARKGPPFKKRRSLRQLRPCFCRRLAFLCISFEASFRASELFIDTKSPDAFSRLQSIFAETNFFLFQKHRNWVQVQVSASLSVKTLT